MGQGQDVVSGGKAPSQAAWRGLGCHMALVSGSGGTPWECSVWMSWGLSVKGDSGRHSADWLVYSMAGCWGGEGGSLIQGNEGSTIPSSGAG